MFDGYLRWGTQEIVNAARVQAYTAASGVNVMQNKKVKADYSTIAATLGVPGAGGPSIAPVYANPATDPAPWYAADRPETADFLGVFPINFSGFTDSTRTTSATELLGDGAAPGIARDGSREMVLSLGLVANNALGLEKGLAWLKNQVDTYDEAIMDFFISKPDPTNSGTVYRSHRRMFHVSVLSGPTVIGEYNFECYSIMQIEITLNAGDPHLYPFYPYYVPTPSTTAGIPSKTFWDTDDVTQVRNLVIDPSLYPEPPLIRNFWQGTIENLPAPLPAAAKSGGNPKANRINVNLSPGEQNATMTTYTQLFLNTDANKFNSENEYFSAAVWVYPPKTTNLRMAARMCPRSLFGSPRVYTYGPVISAPANTWTRVYVEGFPPVPIAYADEDSFLEFLVQLVSPSPVATGDQFFATAAVAHVGTKVLPYFDGNTKALDVSSVTTKRVFKSAVWASTNQQSTTILKLGEPDTYYDILGLTPVDPPTPPQISSDIATYNRQTWQRYYLPIPAYAIPNYGSAVIDFELWFWNPQLWKRSGSRIRLIANPNNLAYPYTGLDETAVLGEMVIGKLPQTDKAGGIIMFFYNGPAGTVELATDLAPTKRIDAEPLLYSTDGGPRVPFEIKNVGTGGAVLCLDLPIPNDQALITDPNAAPFIQTVGVSQKE